MTIWLSQNLHIGVKISHKLCQNTEFNILKIHMLWIFVCLFVCVEVLRPSQPNGVMSSMISLHNHTFTSRNWQLPFLNQQKEENDRRKYFMIDLYERMLLTGGGGGGGVRGGFNPWPPGLQSDGCSPRPARIFVKIGSVKQFLQISKTYVLWGNKNKTRPFLHINLLIKYSVQQLIHFIITATSLGTNAVVVMRVHCTNKYTTISL